MAQLLTMKHDPNYDVVILVTVNDPDDGLQLGTKA
jgi:hypothetical protein